MTMNSYTTRNQDLIWIPITMLDIHVLYTDALCQTIPPSVSIQTSVRGKLSLCLNKHHAMKTYGGMEV
jgi:hypothetical protein